MGGEPWCMTPDQVARLTDHQIHHGYYLPAVKRAQRDEGKPAAPVVQPAPTDREGLKRALIAHYIERGLAPDAARRLADDEFAKMDAAPADAWWRQ